MHLEYDHELIICNQFSINSNQEYYFRSLTNCDTDYQNLKAYCKKKQIFYFYFLKVILITQQKEQHLKKKHFILLKFS